LRRKSDKPVHANSTLVKKLLPCTVLKKSCQQYPGKKIIALHCFKKYAKSQTLCGGKVILQVHANTGKKIIALYG
jgi:hypothetical protein